MSKAAAWGVACALAILLTGCAVHPEDIGREPVMSPVGAGLQSHSDDIATAMFPQRTRTSNGSLWDDSGADLFRDPRASRIGDVVTVNIQINDSASLGNSTDRERNSKVTNTTDFAFSLNKLGSKGSVEGDTSDDSSSKGQGNIDRSEKIQLAVAAIVTNVLPDGNLVIKGTQEVRVNFELRLLDVSGIVRPRDIGRDNSIAYNKIAEARVSYGGRGRLTEVQQPGVGQQLYDNIAPF